MPEFDFETEYTLEDGTVHKIQRNFSDTAGRFRSAYTPVRDRAFLYQNLAAGRTPESEAQVYNLAQKTGWTPAVVREQKEQALQQSLKVNPDILPDALVNFIAKTPDNFGLIQDDTDKLRKSVGLIDRIQKYGSELIMDVQSAFQIGDTATELAQLYYDKFIQGSVDNEPRIKELEESTILPIEREDLFGQIATAFGEQLPFLGSTISAGIGSATKGLITGGALGLIGGPVTAIPGILLGAKAGFAFGAAQEIFVLEAGNAAKEYSEFVDENGAKLDPETVKYAAMTAGFLNAGLEFVGEVALLKTVPGLNRLASDGARKVIKDALKKQSFRSAIKRIALSFGGALAIEPITEMAQEAITIDVGEVTKRIKLPEAEQIAAQDKTERILSAGKQALLATVGLAAPGTSISAANAAFKKANRVLKARSAKEAPKQFYNDHVAISESLEDVKVKKLVPDKMKELLNDSGLDQDVLIDGKEAQDFYQTGDNSKIFTKLNVTEEEVRKAALTGESIPLKLSDIHANLNVEETKKFFQIVRENADSLSFQDSQKINITEELSRVEETFRAINLEEEEFLKEKARVEEEIFNASKIRKIFLPGQTRTYARGVAEIMGAFSRRMAEEGGQTAAETLKKIKTEVTTFKDIREAEEFIGANDLKGVIPLGVTQIYPEGYIVKLFENANSSTLLHETGHVFFNEALSIINMGKASDALIQDFETVKNWLAVNPEEGITGRQQDKFARAFELYLREGKAPSQGLKKIFDRFKNWLTAVYKTITGSALDINLTDEVRDVFDRLLVSERETEQFVERNEFVIPEKVLDEIGMSEEDKLTFRRLMAGMTAKVKSDLQRKLAREHKENIKEWTRQAHIDVAGRRVNNLFAELTSSKRGLDLASSSEFLSAKELNEAEAAVPDIFSGEGMDPKIIAERFGFASVETMFKSLISPLPDTKDWENFNRANNLRDFLKKPILGLNQEEIEFQFGKQTAVRLKAKNPRLIRKDGQSAQSLATEYGYESLTEMIGDLEELVPRKEQINELVKEQERAHYLNFTATDAFLNWNDDLARYFETIGNFINKKAGLEVQIAQKQLQDNINRKIAVTKVRQAMRTDLHLSAMRRALRNRDKAIRKGEFNDAAEFHLQARYNYEFARRSNQIKNDTQNLKNLTKRAAKAKGKIEFDYWKNIVSLGNKFALRTGKEPQDVKSFQNLLEAQGSLLDSGAKFGDWILTKRPMSFRDLTVNEFEEFKILIEVLNHIGRKIVADETALAGIKFAALTEELAATARELPNKPDWDSRSILGRTDKEGKKIMSELNSLHGILSNLDGFTGLGPKGKPGPWETYIFDRLSVADSESLKINADLNDRLREPFNQLAKGFRKYPKIVPGITVPVPELLKLHNRNWYFDTVVSLALNMGNRENIEAVKEGYGLSESDLNNIFKVLTREDWDAIQTIGDAIGSYRERLFATKKRIDGFEPRRVEPDVFVTGEGQKLRGWYYPLKRDLSLIPHREDLFINDGFKETERAGVSPVVSEGALIERKGFGGQPVKLDLSVLAQHINFLSLYISHAEILKDVGKIFSNPELSNLIIGKLGPAALESARNSLNNIARKKYENLEAMDKFFERIRGLSTIYMLGANVSVAIKQIFSITNFWSEYGFGTHLRGALEVIKAGSTGKLGQLRDNVYAMSPMMKNRGSDLDVSINEAIRKSFLESPIPFAFGIKKSQVREALFILIRGADFATTMPAWIGAFESGKKKFNGDANKAAAFADKTIRTTQPSFRPLDLSPIQNSRKGVARAFTMFSTYTLLFGRRQRMYYRAWRQESISSAQFMRAVVLEGLIAPIAMNLTFAALWGDFPEPEDLAADVFVYNLMGIPLVRDMAVIASNIARKKPYGREWDSPLFAPFDLATRMGNFIVKWIQDLDDDKKWRDAVLAMAELFSFSVGVPAPKLGRKMIKGMEQYERGEGTPLNILVPNPNLKK